MESEHVQKFALSETGYRAKALDPRSEGVNIACHLADGRPRTWTVDPCSDGGLRNVGCKEV